MTDLKKMISDFEKWAATAIDKNEPKKSRFFMSHANKLKEIEKNHNQQLEKAMQFGEVLNKPIVKELIDKLINK